MPTAVAIQWVEVTTPKVPSICGRVVKEAGFVLAMFADFTTGWPGRQPLFAGQAAVFAQIF
jgi:hypothetical protein